MVGLWTKIVLQQAKQSLPSYISRSSFGIEALLQLSGTELSGHLLLCTIRTAIFFKEFLRKFYFYAKSTNKSELKCAGNIHVKISRESYINVIAFLMQWHSYTYISNEGIRFNIQGAGIYVVKGKPAVSTSYEPGIKKSSLKCI